MKVSTSELAVLNALWHEQPLTVGQIIERVQQDNDWHHNTIKTLLTRLLTKEAVERYRDGKRYFYRPIVNQEDILTSESEGLLEQFFGGRMAPLIAHFADRNKLSPKDVEDIQNILNNMDKDDE